MSRILHTMKDILAEEKVAEQVSKRWRCEFHRFPQLARVDWYVYRGDTLNAMAELKRRYHNHDKYPTVYLSFAKWASVMELSRAAGVDGYILYGFDDGIWFAEVTDIDPRCSKILGRTDREGVGTDLEPMIEVPINVLREIKNVTTTFEE